MSLISGHKSPIHASSVDPDTGVVTTHVLHDGSQLGVASSAVFINNHFVIGSFADNGILVCPHKTHNSDNAR